MNKRITMKHGILFVAFAGLLLLPGCMSLFHPQAEEWYRQAKGGDRVANGFDAHLNDGYHRSTRRNHRL